MFEGVWIAQAMCEKQHVIIAITFDAAIDTPVEACESLLSMLSALIEQGWLDPWCPTCRSELWSATASPTAFLTMDSARPFLPRFEPGELIRKQES